MFKWLQQNWGTILVVAIVAAVVAAVIVFRVRAHRQGRSSCGCGCGQCAMRGACHSAPKKKDEP